MAAPCESLGHDLKAWAADQLQVEPGSAPAEVRAAYLRRAQLDNGVPNLAAREAMVLLSGRNNAARPTLALEAVEQKLHHEIDDFASRFFALAIADRKAEWEKLHARGQGFVRIAARLAALRPGLYFVLPPLDRDSHLGKLVSAACQLFVLRPPARAAQAGMAQGSESAGRAAPLGSGGYLTADEASSSCRAGTRINGPIGRCRRLERGKETGQSTNARAAQPARQTTKPTSRWPNKVVVTIAVLAMVRVLIGGLFSLNPNSTPSPPPPIPKMVPQFNPNDFLKNKDFRLFKDGEKFPVKVMPKDGAKPGDPPMDKQVPP